MLNPPMTEAERVAVLREFPELGADFIIDPDEGLEPTEPHIEAWVRYWRDLYL
jgi:hypothetical protein